MIVKDGEKFACDACIRGHRVSSCTHKGMFNATIGGKIRRVDILTMHFAQIAN